MDQSTCQLPCIQFAHFYTNYAAINVVQLARNSLPSLLKTNEEYSIDKNHPQSSAPPKKSMGTQE